MKEIKGDGHFTISDIGRYRLTLGYGRFANKNIIRKAQELFGKGELNNGKTIFM